MKSTFAPNGLHGPLTYDGIRLGLKSLVLASLETQLSPHFSDTKNCGLLAYLNEICTIRFSGPRRCGNTTAMCLVGKEAFENPIFLFHTHNMAEHCRKCHDLKTVRSFGSDSAIDSLRGFQCDGLLVDCSFMMPAKRMERLKEVCLGFAAAQETFCLVFVA